MVDPNYVKTVVREILSTPEFVSELQSAMAISQCPSVVRLATTSQPLQVMTTNSTPSTSTTTQSQLSSNSVQQSLSESRVEEIRRLFPSVRGTSTISSASRRTGRKRGFQAIAPKDFKKDVFLVSFDTKKTLVGTQKAKAYQNGFALSAVTFQKDWTEKELHNHLKKLFQEKLNDEFEILLPISGNLVKPNLSTGAQLNGENVCRLFNQKTIYIRCIGTRTYDFTADFTVNSDKPEAKPEYGPKLTTNILSELPMSSIDTDDQFEQDTLRAIENSMHEDEYSNTTTTESMTETETATETYESGIGSLTHLLNEYQNKIDDDHLSYFNVYRDDVFNCCLRALRRDSFSPLNKISVNFTDVDDFTEGAIDAGGPRREMFRLALKFIQNSVVFDGESESSRNLTLNSTSLENHHYYEAGRLITLGIIHCGAGPKYFSETLFSFLINGIDETQPDINDICDQSVKNQILTIAHSNSIEELREAIESSPILDIAGVQTVKDGDFERKHEIFNYAVKYYVLHRTRPALEQFKEGLNILDFLNKAKKFHTELRNLLCYEGGELSYTTVNSLFSEILSEDGSNKRRIESKILAFWRDYLLDCQENSADVKLRDILAFSTGSDCIPSLGFTHKPTIEFIHNDCPYPKANTCALVLYLPTMHNTYNTFKSKMDFAILNGMVFGFE